MLCSVCSSISLKTLLPLSSAYAKHRNGWDHIKDMILNKQKVTPRGLFGVPHQPDLQSLRSSATECELCHLIFSQIDLVISEFRVAQALESFRAIHDSGYPTFDLFLTRRGQGERVFG